MTKQVLDITSIGARGDGLAIAEDGKQVFVPLTVTGEKVEAELSPAGKEAYKAENIKLISAGDDRHEARCEHYTKCGGCDMQHMSDDVYRSWIKDRVVMAMAHHGFEGLDIKDPIISPPASRRRVNMKAVKVKGGVQLGFNQRQSHVVVDLKECPVTAHEITSKHHDFRDVLSKLLKEREAAEVQVTLTENGLDVVFKLPRELDLDARMDLGKFAEAADIACLRVNIGGFSDDVAERRQPIVRFGKVGVRIPAGSFLQATKCGEDAMVDLVKQEIEGAKKVADLFCGLGTFAIPLAERASVHAVEGAKNLLAALQSGANQTSGLHQVTTEHRDLFRRPLFAHELNGFDAVVFDPPRAGAKAQVEEIAQSTVPTVIGVSCNPNTFSRDARTLVDAGYTLDYIQPVDQFLWSHHVELVGVFRK